MTAMGTLAVHDDRMKELKDFDDSKIGVKGLSDSGVATIPRIFVKPPEILSDIKSSSPVCAEIPVIDLSNINSINHRPKIVEQIQEAASTWGFFQVINHGVPISILDGIITAIKAFHEQPQEVKAKYYGRQERKGIVYASNNDLYRSKAATWHDYLQVWKSPEPPQADKIPAICRNEVMAWDEHATTVGEMVAELLSEGLGLNAGKIKELALLDMRLSVGTCYPYCPQPDLTVGLSHHTDPGVVTVLLQNQVPGLQVKHGGAWVHVKPVPGALIVNIGDFLQIVSNGEYKSVEHRVLANPQRDSRITVIEFFGAGDGNDSDHYGPLPELLSPEKPAIYRTFTKQELLENFFSKGLDSKSLIKKVKL